MSTTASTARRLAAACATSALVLAGTSGCAVANMITSEETRHFDAVADAPTSGDLAFVLPDGIVGLYQRMSAKLTGRSRGSIGQPPTTVDVSTVN